MKFEDMKFENNEFKPMEDNDLDLCRNTTEWKVDDVTKYYYGPVLQKALAMGKLESYTNKIYLVVFRVPNKNSNRIVYRYLDYSDIFAGSLLLYLITKTNFSKRLLFRNWGDFFTIIQLSKYNIYPEIYYLNDKLLGMNDHFNKFMNFNPSANMFSSNTQESFDLIKKTTVTTFNLISCIHLAIKKDYKSFINLFFDYNQIDNKSSKDLYIIKDCLFITQDLGKVIKDLGDLDYDVKEANRKSQSDLMDAFLHNIDSEYIDSLYDLHYTIVRKHHIFHRSWLLPRVKFSYENIHTNIGNSQLRFKF